MPVEERISPSSGRRKRLERFHHSDGAMLTAERLSEVAWALGKLQDASNAVDKLVAGEPEQQPPTSRGVEMEAIGQELGRLSRHLESLYA